MSVLQGKVNAGCCWKRWHCSEVRAGRARGGMLSYCRKLFQPFIRHKASDFLRGKYQMFLRGRKKRGKKNITCLAIKEAA